MAIERADKLSLRTAFIVSDILLFILAFLTGETSFFFSAVFLFLFFVIIWIYLTLVIRGLFFARSHSSSAVEGEEFFVECSIANFSYLPVFCLRVDDGFSPGRSFSLDRTVRDTIFPRSVYEYTNRTWISRKMGTYRIGPVRLKVSDPFGLLSRTRTLEHYTDLTVYPSVRFPGRLNLMDEPLIRKIGEEAVASAGVSSDFRGQREYRREDSKRVIHWRATARRGDLVVKEFDERGITEIAVYSDCRSISLRGTGNVTTHDLSLTASASVLAAAASRGFRFSLTFAGYGGGKTVPFGSGVYHLHTVLQSMVGLGKPGKYADYIKEVEASIYNLKRNGSAVLVFSQTATDIPAAAQIIRNCRVRSVKIVAVIIDDRSFIKLFPEQLEMERGAPHIRYTRELLESAGASVFVLSKNDIPAEVFEQEDPGPAKSRGNAS